MSGVKNRPATPLPWRSSHDGVVGQRSLIRVADSSGAVKFADDRDYIAHSGNAYPILVEALRGIALRHKDGTLCFDGCEKAELQERSPFCARYQEILRKLGEDV